MTRKAISLIISLAALLGLAAVWFGMSDLISRTSGFQTGSAQQQERSIPPKSETAALKESFDTYIENLNKRLTDLKIPVVTINVLESQPFRIAVIYQSAGPSSGSETGSFEDAYYWACIRREALAVAVSSKTQLESLEIRSLGNDGKPMMTAVTTSGDTSVEMKLIEGYSAYEYENASASVLPSKVDNAEVASEITKLIDVADTRLVVSKAVTVTQHDIAALGQFVEVRYRVPNYTHVTWDLPRSISRAIESLNKERGATIHLLRLRIESEDGIPICEYVEDYQVPSQFWSVTEDMDWPPFSSPPAGAKLPFRKSAYPPK